MVGQEAEKDFLYFSPRLSNVHFIWLDQFSNLACYATDLIVLARGGSGEDMAEEERASDCSAVQIGQILKAHATILKKTGAKTIKTIISL